MEAKRVRRAALKLVYEGRNVSADLAPFLLGVTYTDHAQGQADSLDIALDDRDRRWQGAWSPTEGDRIRAWIVLTDWRASGDRYELSCGTFDIDEPTLTGSPDRVEIKAVSALVRTSLRRERKSKAWESTGVRRVAQDIAQAHGLSLYWDAEDIRLDRIDQRDETDLAFLNRLCQELGLSLKCAEEKIIVYEGRRFDARAPVATISRGRSWLGNYRFKGRAGEVYRACQVSYFDPDVKRLMTSTYEPPGAPQVGHTLKISQRATSQAEARRRARSELRRHNKHQVEAELTLAGEPGLVGGVTVLVEGFGNYDGKYFAEKAVHRLGEGSVYTTRVDLRKVLVY